MKWNSTLSHDILASISEDLKLKIWREDENESPGSGRRWKVIFRQSSAHATVYTSLSFINLQHETFLAIVTRDGLLSLLEPVNALHYDDWKETDQIWVCGASLGRNFVSNFKLAFKPADSIDYYADGGAAGKALTIAVAALEAVKVYRIVSTGRDGPYRFHNVAAELGGSRGMVRDVAWAPRSFSPRSLIATTSVDDYLRIYQLTPNVHGENSQSAKSRQPSTAVSKSSGISAGLTGTSRVAADWPAEAGQIIYEVKMVAELKQEGVWKIEWLRGGRHGTSNGCDWR